MKSCPLIHRHSPTTSTMAVFLLSIFSIFIVVSSLVFLTNFQRDYSLKSLEVPLQKMGSYNSESFKVPPNFKYIPTISECGHLTALHKRKPRLIGGKRIQNDLTYPWMAQIHYSEKFNKDFFGCGATLISRRYILTSAHCVHCRNPVKIKLNTRMDDPFGVDETIVHPRYNRSCGSKDTRLRQYDIALIRLDREVESSEPICLPFRRFYNDLDWRKFGSSNKHLAAGWGVLNSSNSTSDGKRPEPSKYLHEVALSIIPHKTCQAAYENTDNITRVMICAGDKVMEDICDGDSGGPFFTTVEDKVFQAGIASFGKVPCGSGAPSVFLNVTSYLPWILSSLRP